MPRACGLQAWRYRSQASRRHVAAERRVPVGRPSAMVVAAATQRAVAQPLTGRRDPAAYTASAPRNQAGSLPSIWSRDLALLRMLWRTEDVAMRARDQTGALSTCL